jgi:hypothetical protein
MVGMALANVKQNSCVQQFSHWNQDKVGTEQNWYPDYCQNSYDIKITNVTIDSTGKGEALTISLSKSDLNLIINRGGHMQG